MPKIAFIQPYFGTLPPYFPIYIETCRHNPDVAFLFFTDCKTPEQTPDNVIFHPFTLAQFNALASEKLKLNIALTNPFHLCDMKVTYGVVFEDYLKGYDFWGHADIDLIYGDIRQFITDELLTQHDVIFARSEYVSGFFALYRNTPEINQLYRKSKDHVSALTTPKHFSFGECNFAWDALKQGQSIFEVETEIESMTHVIMREAANKQLRAYFKTMAYEATPNRQQAIWWHHGQLEVLNHNTPLLLFHFVSAKQTTAFNYPKWQSVPDEFFITNRGFFMKHEFKGLSYQWAILRKKFKQLIKIFKKVKKKYL